MKPHSLAAIASDNRAVTMSAPAIGVVAFAVDGAVTWSLELQPGARVRAASVVKPLLAWAASWGPLAGDGALWEVIARRSVMLSDNEATAALWSRGGHEGLLAALNDRLGLAWQVEGDGEHPSLRVVVTAGELAHAYTALASDETTAGSHVRRWMREVPANLTFGVRRVACDTLGVGEEAVAVKCGWFGGERAHAVVLVETHGGVVAAAVTTQHALEPATRASVRRAIGSDIKLAAAHDVLAGEEIRAATRRALLVASGL